MWQRDYPRSRHVRGFSMDFWTVFKLTTIVIIIFTHRMLCALSCEPDFYMWSVDLCFALMLFLCDWLAVKYQAIIKKKILQSSGNSWKSSQAWYRQNLCWYWLEGAEQVSPLEGLCRTGFWQTFYFILSLFFLHVFLSLSLSLCFFLFIFLW